MGELRKTDRVSGRNGADEFQESCATVNQSESTRYRLSQFGKESPLGRRWERRERWGRSVAGAGSTGFDARRRRSRRGSLPQPAHSGCHPTPGLPPQAPGPVPRPIVDLSNHSPPSAPTLGPHCTPPNAPTDAPGHTLSNTSRLPTPTGHCTTVDPSVVAQRRLCLRLLIQPRPSIPRALVTPSPLHAHYIDS